MTPKCKPPISSDWTEEAVSSCNARGKLVGIVCAKPHAITVQGIREDFSGRALVRRGMWEKTCFCMLFLKKCCTNDLAPV